MVIELLGEISIYPARLCCFGSVCSNPIHLSGIDRLRSVGRGCLVPIRCKLKTIFEFRVLRPPKLTTFCSEGGGSEKNTVVIKCHYNLQLLARDNAFHGRIVAHRCSPL